ncbi:hypothetical protein BCR33DRAFT_846638 [Rhizoclosmatium globosum]|uniref:L domain-like protein n=1 Tax=Rhizoclosmatium globosum TaxID=329046 RepID=A0A1Y2CV92_9FUNG|nr:hypothetical protein BCR33DRAFT_846638 [Rhizoclosmatium globosum]|eukprot:ORY50979.1 hypothetical protein BCR33DRAFT_846638 [Rhizoclosmatium globosum]
MVGPLPDNWGGFSSMFQMHLLGNHFSGPVPSSFSGLTGMQYFHIENNLFSGPLPDLSGWKLITVAVLSGNCITGSSTNPAIVISGQNSDCDAKAAALGVPNQCNAAAPPPVDGPVTTTGNGFVAPTVAINTNTASATKTVAQTTKAITTATSTLATTTAAASTDSSSNVPLIAGIAGGAVVLLILIGVIIWCCIRKSKTKESDGYEFETKARYQNVDQNQYGRNEGRGGKGGYGGAAPDRRRYEEEDDRRAPRRGDTQTRPYAGGPPRGQSATRGGDRGGEYAPRREPSQGRGGRDPRDNRQPQGGRDRSAARGDRRGDY